MNEAEVKKTTCDKRLSEFMEMLYNFTVQKEAQIFEIVFVED